MTTIVRSDGSRVPVRFDKILDHIQTLAHDLNNVDAIRVSKRVVEGIRDGVTTTELDDLAADTAASLTAFHPEYSILAARIAVTRLHKMTSSTIECMFPYMHDEVVAFARENLEAIDAVLDWSCDLKYDYFGFKTLQRSYLTRNSNGDIVERPQMMIMRVALGIHCGDLNAVLETYDHMSRGIFTHATPTMFNAGTKFPHLASCFLLPISDDSIEGIMETNKKCALISKSAGGIGFSVSNVRGTGSRIHSTGGTSSGILPMLKCFEQTARYVDQGGGKRNGAFCAYLEPWHLDVRCFLDMKKNQGAEELRARDLFYALWIPNIFMERVASNGTWSLLCPSKCGDLIDLYGTEFSAAYEEYERTQGCVVETMRAQDLWFAILDAQVETGTPFMLYKDACNQKSNQKNLGTIRSSNLCTEIVQYSSPDEIAVCNLASIALPKFVIDGAFSFLELNRVVNIVTRNLNRVIDRNMYALPEARASNLRHRPIGIGVQGLADVFAMLSYPFDSPQARKLNRDIFETIYFSALQASCALAAEVGPYETYDGSPISKGILQMDMWDTSPTPSGLWSWDDLRQNIAKHGVRNSLLVAPMPTASTAQILGNNECFEPYTSNVFVRRVLSGEFAIVNKHLVRDLSLRGLWNEEIRQLIIAADGSVQGIPSIPNDLKEVYRTVWEISMRGIIDMAADRAPYIDQSMSMNLFMSDPTHERLTSMHFYAWKKGLKTGMYYLRTRASTDAVKVTIDPTVVEAAAACRRGGGGDCLMCSA